jgi:hypothetical protein
MRIIGTLFISALLLPTLSGCDDDICGAPDQAQYSQPPITPGQDGCQGRAPDTDKTYPLGTRVRLPECLPAYPSEVATCTCSGTSPQWTCPI